MPSALRASRRGFMHDGDKGTRRPVDLLGGLVARTLSGAIVRNDATGRAMVGSIRLWIDGTRDGLHFDPRPRVRSGTWRRGHPVSGPSGARAQLLLLYSTC